MDYEEKEGEGDDRRSVKSVIMKSEGQCRPHRGSNSININTLQHEGGGEARLCFQQKQVRASLTMPEAASERRWKRLRKSADPTRPMRP